MPVPAALEPLDRVVVPLEVQELGELRVSGVDLRARGPAVIGEEEAAVPFEAPVDQPPKIGRSLLYARW